MKRIARPATADDLDPASATTTTCITRSAQALASDLDPANAKTMMRIARPAPAPAFDLDPLNVTTMTRLARLYSRSTCDLHGWARVFVKPQLVEAVAWSDLNRLARSCRAGGHVATVAMRPGSTVHVHQRRMEEAIAAPARTYRTDLPPTALRRVPLNVRTRSAQYKRDFATQLSLRLLRGGSATGDLQVDRREGLVRTSEP